MRLTVALNVGNHYLVFTRLWFGQRHKLLKTTGAITLPKDSGIPVYKPSDVITDTIKITEDPAWKVCTWRNAMPPAITIPPPEPLPDSSHPLWQDEMCFMYDNTVKLVDGLAQAKVLTKTVEITDNALPADLKNNVDTIPLTQSHHGQIKRIIQQAKIFDATQVKLPKRTDPKRPWMHFAVDYGIPLAKQNSTMMKNMFRLFDCTFREPDTVSELSLFENCKLSLSIRKDDDLLLFKTSIPLMVSSRKLLRPFARPEEVKEAISIELPDIYPLKSYVDFEQTNTYVNKDFLSLKKNCQKPCPHTLLMLYNTLPFDFVDTQFTAFGLVHLFTVAASVARQQFGKDVKDLPTPVALQAILSDGKQFQFQTFQLNTLDLDGMNGTRNIFWQTPFSELFDKCDDSNGFVMFEGYNPDVVRHIAAFYTNNHFS